jgi:NADPH2:quinone reductase
VIGTAGSPAGLDLVKKLGASQVFDHRSHNYLEQILQFTAGQGVDLIIEMASEKNLDKDLGLLAKRGRVVIVGNRGPIQIDPRQTMIKDSDIRGMALMHADTAELALIHAALDAGFTNGSLSPIVQMHLPLSDAGKAHEAVMESGSLGKIVLRP